MLRYTTKAVVVLFVLAPCTLSGWAQVTTATLYGIVTDPTGAVIPNARITLTHEGTGAVTTKSTDAQGEAVFNFLPVGSYTLGFLIVSASTAERQTITLTVRNQLLQHDLPLSSYIHIEAA